MKLEDKGKILPPPVLNKYSEVVSKEVQKWPHIIAATHWEIWYRNQANGADFYVGELELGHIHRDGSIQIPSTKNLSCFDKGGFGSKVSLCGKLDSVFNRM